MLPTKNKMKSTINGPYPRVGSELSDLIRKELNKPQEKQSQKIETLKTELAKETLNELKTAGIDIPNTGLIDVYDEISWPLEFANGIEFGGMKKIFHTNTHHREIIATGEINLKKNLNIQTKAGTKIELPGPYTLACNTIKKGITPYNTILDLAKGYAKFLNELIKPVQEQTELIQFNEPSVIAYKKENFYLEKLQEVYCALLEQIKTKTAVWTFYGKYDEKTLDILLSLPVDAVGLDFVWHPEVLELLKKKSPKQGIGFGIIDCADRGNIFLENTQDIVKKIKELEGCVDFSKSYIAPNATLEHLPRDYARKKAELTAQICQEVNK